MLEFLRSYACFGFHLSRKSREWLELPILGINISGPSKNAEIDKHEFYSFPATEPKWPV